MSQPDDQPDPAARAAMERAIAAGEAETQRRINAKPFGDPRATVPPAGITVLTHGGGVHIEVGDAYRAEREARLAAEEGS